MAPSAVCKRPRRESGGAGKFFSCVTGRSFWEQSSNGSMVAFECLGFDAAAQDRALQALECEIKGKPEQRQHEDAGDDETCIEVAVGDEDQITKPLIGTDEFADDGANDCERAGDFQTAEDRGQGIRKAHVAENIERIATHGPDEM